MFRNLKLRRISNRLGVVILESMEESVLFPFDFVSSKVFFHVYMKAVIECFALRFYVFISFVSVRLLRKVYPCVHVKSYEGS